MTTITRNPTMVAACGCPYDPVYDEDALGWHLLENHPAWRFRLSTPLGIVRQPTVEESELFGRETWYASLRLPAAADWRELGDYVIESHNHDPDDLEKLAEVCELFGICDAAHVIPGVGVYLEE